MVTIGNDENKFGIAAWIEIRFCKKTSPIRIHQQNESSVPNFQIDLCVYNASDESMLQSLN